MSDSRTISDLDPVKTAATIVASTRLIGIAYVVELPIRLHQGTLTHQHCVESRH